MVFIGAQENLKFREIGPAIMGGRVDNFAVVESDPKVVYVAMASGGIWKTTNTGTTWQSLFDQQSVASIGDVAVALSDPSIVWVGTGEPNNRQSSSWGDGIYKSMDGGKCNISYPLVQYFNYSNLHLNASSGVLPLNAPCGRSRL